jgi:rhodanese-related sulfurtransferase
MLYDSLRNKIMILDDDVIVYPGHGQGTSCGKDLSSETVGKLGDQKLTNYALRENMTKDEFVNEVLNGLTEPPKYFPSNVHLNKEGYLEPHLILNNSLKPLNVNFVENMMNNVTLLDVRNEDDFAESHIPGSIFIGLHGRFAPWAGEILEDINQPIILIAPNGKEEEAILRLSRVGFDNIKGYLLGGIDSWTKANKNVESIENIDPEDFASLFSNNNLNILDVRSQSENNSNSIKESLNIPLINLKDKIQSINDNDKLYIHCKGGYRSMIACSILNSKSKTNIVNIKGGFDKISTFIS